MDGAAARHGLGTHVIHQGTVVRYALHDLLPGRADFLNVALPDFRCDDLLPDQIGVAVEILSHQDAGNAPRVEHARRALIDRARQRMLP